MVLSAPLNSMYLEPVCIHLLVGMEKQSNNKDMIHFLFVFIFFMKDLHYFTDELLQSKT